MTTLSGIKLAETTTVTNNTAGSSANADTAQAQKTEDLKKDELGREEYITDCVKKILLGKSVSVTYSGGMFVTADSLPEKVQQFCGHKGKSKEIIWFPGYNKSAEEIIGRIQKQGKEVICKTFYSSNSDFFPGMGPDGYTISLKV